MAQQMTPSEFQQELESLVKNGKYKQANALFESCPNLIENPEVDLDLTLHTFMNNLAKFEHDNRWNETNQDLFKGILKTDPHSLDAGITQRLKNSDIAPLSVKEAAANAINRRAEMLQEHEAAQAQPQMEQPAPQQEQQQPAPAPQQEQPAPIQPAPTPQQDIKNTVSQNYLQQAQDHISQGKYAEALFPLKQAKSLKESPDLDLKSDLRGMMNKLVYNEKEDEHIQEPWDANKKAAFLSLAKLDPQALTADNVDSLWKLQDPEFEAELNGVLERKEELRREAMSLEASPQAFQKALEATLQDGSSKKAAKLLDARPDLQGIEVAAGLETQFEQAQTRLQTIRDERYAAAVNRQPEPTLTEPEIAPLDLDTELTALETPEPAPTMEEAPTPTQPTPQDFDLGAELDSLGIEAADYSTQSPEPEPTLERDDDTPSR